MDPLALQSQRSPVALRCGIPVARAYLCPTIHATPLIQAGTYAPCSFQCVVPGMHPLGRAAPHRPHQRGVKDGAPLNLYPQQAEARKRT
ncbi:hypothetical protein ACVWW4_000494 [Bradyrhizobium sp. LB7.1]